MKKKHPRSGLICLVILGGIGGWIFLAGGAKAEITIGEKTYEMRTVSVRECRPETEPAVFGRRFPFGVLKIWHKNPGTHSKEESP